MKPKIKINERVDQLYSSDVKIIQSSQVFSFSLDAVLLANFTSLNAKRDKSIVDLCAGNGAVGLFLSPKTKARVTMVEIQSLLADMASRSIQLNDLGDRFHVINDSIANVFNYLSSDSVDVVTCNPPYFVNRDQSTKNVNEHLTIARHEVLTSLSEVLNVSSRLLKMNGKLFMVHRPERLDDILFELKMHRLAPKRIQFVHPHVNDNANMVLIEAIKDGGPNGVKIIPPIITYSGNNYSKEVETILYGNTD